MIEGCGTSYKYKNMKDVNINNLQISYTVLWIILKFSISVNK